MAELARGRNKDRGRRTGVVVESDISGKGSRPRKGGADGTSERERGWNTTNREKYRIGGGI